LTRVYLTRVERENSVQDDGLMIRTDKIRAENERCLLACQYLARGNRDVSSKLTP
jgi:hypothetical protein